jgi:hypothetical protein
VRLELRIAGNDGLEGFRVRLAAKNADEGVEGCDFDCRTSGLRVVKRKEPERKWEWKTGRGSVDMRS